MMMRRWSGRQEDFFPLNGMAKDCHGQVAGEIEREREREREIERERESARERVRVREREKEEGAGGGRQTDDISSVRRMRRREAGGKTPHDARAPKTHSGMAG
jgi:hypothetical protein